jgi:hypothetical protein
MKLRIIYSILSLGCLLPFTGCMTSRNTERLENYRNPGTELRIHPSSVCHGTIQRTDSSFTLAVGDLLSSGRILVLNFPATPTTERTTATAKIVDRKADPNHAGTPVEIEMMSGGFDNSIRIDDKMSFSGGLPTRLTLGVYWNLDRTGDRQVKYTVGYKYSPEQRFATATGDAELLWMTRSHATTTGYCLLYVFTVPLDIVTSPCQLIGYALASKMAGWQ